MTRDEASRADSCVVVVGSTGTGKSSTIALVTGAEVILACDWSTWVT